MGYFPNGTAGECYEAEFCNRCIHRDGPNGDTGCAVWLAHMLHNYRDCNDENSILHLLIPRDDEGGNERCLMFAERAPEADRVQLVDLIADDQKAHERRVGG